MKYKRRLQAEEREQISLLLSSNSTMMQIAASLNRSVSTDAKCFLILTPSTHN
jgi:IS30 family transposase